MSDLIRLFDDSVPSQFQRESLRLIFQNYARSYRECEERYETPEAHDILAHHRRALIEQDWRSLSYRFSELSASPQLNKTKGNWHTKVVSGRVVITQHLIEHYRAMVRDAEFRSDYAGAYQTAFEFMKRHLPPEDGYMYAVLIHAPHPDRLSLPAFVDVAFPARDWSHYLERIELLQRYPDLAEELSGGQREEIKSPNLDLRRDIRRRFEQQSEG